MATIPDCRQGYGPYVISDLTNYCDQDDLEALLRRRFPATAEWPEPWKLSVECSMSSNPFL